MLDDSQKKEIARWLAAGDSLDAIQKRIKADWGIHLTYFELRMLAADLPQPQEPAPEEPAPGKDDQPPAQEEPAPDEKELPDGLRLDFDGITDPRFLASGSVIFSDGVSAKWFVDAVGRLGLTGCPQGYQPSGQDAQAFQRQLSEGLAARGLV